MTIQYRVCYLLYADQILHAEEINQDICYRQPNQEYFVYERGKGKRTGLMKLTSSYSFFIRLFIVPTIEEDALVIDSSSASTHFCLSSPFLAERQIKPRLSAQQNRV